MVAGARQVQGFWFLAGRSGTAEKNSDTATPPGPGRAGKVTPAARAVKWSRVRDASALGTQKQKAVS